MSHKELLELLDEVASTLFFFSDDYRVGEKYDRESVADLYFRVEDILAELKEEAQK